MSMIESDHYALKDPPTTIRGQLKEFCEAMGIENRKWPGFPDLTARDKAYNLIAEELEELLVADQHDNLTEVADALGDLAYVVEAAFQAYGIDSRPIIAEIHRTNMLKAGGPKRADGKQLKPPGWEPPRIRELLDDQLREALERDAVNYAMHRAEDGL